jgi:hypothetical protein
VNETYRTSVLLKWLRSRSCKVLKHADFFTAGVPDVTASIAGRTTWLELKYQGEKDKLKKLVGGRRMPQLMTMVELEQIAAAAFYVVWTERSPNYKLRTEIWSPKVLLELVHHDTPGRPAYSVDGNGNELILSLITGELCIAS